MTNRSAALATAVAVGLCAALVAAEASAAPAHRPAARSATHAARTIGAGSDGGSDVRCLLISRLLMQSSDQSRQAMGAAGSLYFAARLERRMTDSQIENALVADAQKPPPAPAQTKGCGDILDARLQELDNLSKRVDVRLDVLSRKAAARTPAASSPEPPGNPAPEPAAAAPQPPADLQPAPVDAPMPAATAASPTAEPAQQPH